MSPGAGWRGAFAWALPYQGSEVVDAFGDWWLFRKLNGPAGGELGTGSDSTPNKLGPVEFELGVIAGDRSINLINSMIIKGSDDGEVSVERTKVDGMKEHIIVHSTHPYLMKNKDVIENTITFLQTGSFHNPATISLMGVRISMISSGYKSPMFQKCVVKWKTIMS